MLTQTLNYLDAFSRFRQKENVEAVERLLSAHKQLAKFERAQIGTQDIPSSCAMDSLPTYHSCRLAVLRNRRGGQDPYPVPPGQDQR